MAAGSGQISPLHIAIAASGGLLLYAALRNVSPLQALKDVTSGSPPAVSTEGKTIEGEDPPAGSGSSTWEGEYKGSKIAGTGVLTSRALFVAAAQTHAHEKYSQAKRWEKGYSDCASFVGKSLIDVGAKPPGGSVTTDYLSSGDWIKVSKPRMGDVAVNASHMAIFTDSSNGIGMQNSRRNVQKDKMSNLMANTGSWEIRRYKRWV